MEIIFVLLHGLEERLTFICVSAEEQVQSCEASVKHLNLLNTCRELHIQDGGHLVRVGFDTPLSEQISRELSGGHSEGAFLGVKSDLILSEAIKCLAQMLQVVDTSEALHKHVIDVHLHGTPDLLLENFVDHPLESCSSIFQSEGRHLVAVDPSIGD